MAKFDAVDRLMQLATEKAASSRRGGAKNSAEPGTPPETGSDLGTAPASAPLPLASPGERGRQLLGALRPLLPAVSGALRMVDHGAVQTVARLLPLLGSVRTSPAPASAPQPAPAPSFPRAAFEKEQAALGSALGALRTRVEAQEDQIRRTREALERTVAEQGALTRTANGLRTSVRVLTAALVLIFLLVITEGALLAIGWHR